MDYIIAFTRGAIVGLALVFLYLLLSIFATDAEAGAPVCGPRNEIVEHLLTKYGEHPIGRGLTADGKAVFELWVDPVDGSFTGLISLPTGQACLVLAGGDWDDGVIEPLPGPSI